MENKVTSYELSKQLHELGFKSESHNGWWGESSYSSMGYNGTQLLWVKDIPSNDGSVLEGFIKAYDCHDLLMWLIQYSDGDMELRLFNSQDRKSTINPQFIFQQYRVCYEEDQEPQNALAKAIIHILKEKQQWIGKN